jgi:L-ascorbate metabolism protein UlaG (beta-lactamase superfamily)
MPEEAVQASVDLNASAMLAVHWGMFDLSIHAWYEPILRVTAAAQAKEVSLLTPRIGEIVSIGRDVPSDNWWQPLLPESK